MAKVVVDAGHGGSDSGAVYNGRLEKEDNLNIALAVGEILESYGLDVEYTRVEDVYDSPVEKARIANAAGADYFVSIHRNSSPTPNQYSGVETLVYDRNGIKLELAENINAGLEEAGFANLGVEARPNLAVLRRTNMPAVLVEVGFINNEQDNRLLDNNFDEITRSIADAIYETVTGETLQVSGKAVPTPMGPGPVIPVTPVGPVTPVTPVTPIAPNEQSSERYFIQVGVFRNYQNAAIQAYGIERIGYPVQIRPEGAFYAVWVGEGGTLQEATELEQDLSTLGYDTLLVSYQ